VGSEENPLATLRLIFLHFASTAEDGMQLVCWCTDAWYKYNPVGTVPGNRLSVLSSYFRADTCSMNAIDCHIVLLNTDSTEPCGCSLMMKRNPFVAFSTADN
jgi:hypothetical protein